MALFSIQPHNIKDIMTFDDIICIASKSLSFSYSSLSWYNLCMHSFYISDRAGWTHSWILGTTSVICAGHGTAPKRKGWNSTCYFTWLYWPYTRLIRSCCPMEWLIFQAGRRDWSMLCGDRIINGKLPLIRHELCHSQNPSGVGGGGVACSQIYYYLAFVPGFALLHK